MAKKKLTIKKHLEQKGFTVIEQDGILTLAQELQKETLTYVDETDYSFEYAPSIYDGNYDCSISEEIELITGDGWMWECEYPTCFKLYRD